MLAAVLVAGCTEDDDYTSDNRGSNTEPLPTSVGNAFIAPAFIAGRCAIQIGGPADLRFTVSNSRPNESERLLAITTDAADAVVVSSGSALDIGPKMSEPITASITGLRDSARPGTSVDVTFRFAKAGDLDLRVPVEACPAQQP